MDYTRQDDETLIRWVTQGRADALGELYDRYSRLVFSVAVTIVGDHATAEEIILDVFTRVWQKAATYRADQAKVSTWLTSITRHHAIDVLRRQSARLDYHSVSWDEAFPTAHSPEEIVELSMRREHVRAAVAQLPVDQKQALAMAYFKGYTHRQIAETLDQPLGTVKTRIRLAMQKLRQMLQDEH